MLFFATLLDESLTKSTCEVEVRPSIASVLRFNTVRKAYVYYSVSVKKEERIRISEFMLSAHDDNQLDHSSERYELNILSTCLS